MDSLASYMRDVRRFPVLRRGEDAELAPRAAAGDPEARRRLVEGCLRLVVKIAGELQRAHPNGKRVATLDLIQAGNLALMRAAETFEPGKAAFTTYAALWIRGPILRCLKLAKRGPDSLDAEAPGERETVGDLVPSEDGSPEDAFARDDVRRSVRAALTRIATTPRERELVERRLLAEDPETTAEMGKRWGVTRQRVDQIERVLVKCLRESWTMRELAA